MGDVLRRSQAAHGSFLRQLRQYLSGQGIQHIRADDARRHAVHPDVGGGQLRRQRSGQADEGRLGAGVGDLAAGAPQSQMEEVLMMHPSWWCSMAGSTA